MVSGRVKKYILFSVDFPGSDVSLGSQKTVSAVSAVAILDSSIKLCMRVVDKKVNYVGLLCCREL